MFEFMTRRHAQPADAPLEGVRFTREDIFLLAGGVDFAALAINEFAFDIVGYARHRGAPWREDMVARLAPLGLVDSSGAPSDELAAAVGPLSSLGVMVMDGEHPTSRRDPRTASVSIDGDRATALVKADRRGGFRVVPLGERGAWSEKAERIFGLPPVHPAPEPASYRFPLSLSTEAGDCLAVGDVGRARAVCGRAGLPEGPVCEFAGRVGSDRGMRREARLFCGMDYRDSSLLEPEGVFDFRMVNADGERFRTKLARVYPSQGATFIEAYARTPSGEMDSFVCVDFLSPGFDLLAYMTDFYDFPPEPGEEGASCSSS